MVKLNIHLPVTMLVTMSFIIAVMAIAVFLPVAKKAIDDGFGIFDRDDCLQFCLSLMVIIQTIILGFWI